MKKLFFSLSLFLCFSTLVNAQIDATVNTTAIGLGATSTLGTFKFAYQNNSIPHYGLSWFVDQDVAGNAPMCYLSGYTGLKFFTAGSVKMSINQNGNVGIGTTTAKAQLHLFGANQTTSALSTSIVSGGALYVQDSGGSPGNGGSLIFGVGQGAFAGIKSLLINGDGNSIGDLAFSTRNGATDATLTERMRILAGGNIAIGTSDPKGYKLAVNGSVIATSVTVKLNSAWPDYVFQRDYQLPSLQEVKAYIDQNQHLPEIPSEQQIAKEGLNLGEMNKLLMKKVEELTLYLIEKDNELKEQKVQVTVQQQKIQSQEIRINDLDKKLQQLVQKLN